MKIQINAICKMHDQIWTPQIKRDVHTKKSLHQQLELELEQEKNWVPNLKDLIQLVQDLSDQPSEIKKPTTTSIKQFCRTFQQKTQQTKRIFTSGKENAIVNKMESMKQNRTEQNGKHETKQNSHSNMLNLITNSFHRFEK